MKSVSMPSTKPDRRPATPRQQQHEMPAQPPHAQPLSPCEDLHVLIAKRAYDLYGARGYLSRSALDDWLDAEREILSQIPPV